MLIYDKLSDSIDIFTMEPNKEKIKKYRKRAVKTYKDDLYLCYLKTNNENTISNLRNTTDIDNHLLNYDNSSVLDYGTWSDIFMSKDHEEEKKKIIEKYIEGEYDRCIPTRVFEYDLKDNVEKDIYRLLKTKEYHISSTNSHGNIYKIDNMLNLPQNLYYLQQLLLGKYENIASENISYLLNLFNFEFYKNVKIKEIVDMLETGLVTGSVDSVTHKAEIGSKVLKKVKIKK